MSKRRYHDDDAFDERGILRDGARFRVPHRMADGLTRDVADQIERARSGDVRVVDLSGNAGPALRRPGFRLVDPRDVSKQMRDAVDQAYSDYETDLTSAYKNNPPTGEGSGEFVGQREHDLCTIDGRPGRLVRDDETGELVCMADHPSGERDTRTVDERVRDHELRMVEEYDAYDRALRDAWRQP